MNTTEHSQAAINQTTPEGSSTTTYTEYHPVAIANYFVQLARKKSEAVDLLKLVKLVYMAHGWSLYFYHQPLVDESAEAWPYGPVMPSVYHTFKDSRRQQIKNIGRYFDLSEKKYKIPKVLKEDKRTQCLLKKVWRAYYNFTGAELSDLTHLPDSAWDKTKAMNSRLRNQHISDDLIKQEFNERFEEYGKTINKKIERFEDLPF